MSETSSDSIAVGNVTFVSGPNADDENIFPNVSTNFSNLFPKFALVNEIRLHSRGWVSKLVSCKVLNRSEMVFEKRINAD